MNKKGQASKIIPILVIGGIILLVVLGRGFELGGKAFLEARFYDKDGNLIEETDTFAVVGGIEGVHSMDLTVNVENTGDKPLTMDIISVSPTLFSNALIKTQKTVDVGQSVNWISNTFLVESFVGTTQRFSVTAKGTYQVGIETKELTKTGYLDLTFDPDPTGDFTVSVDSTFAGDSGSGDLPPTGNVIYRATVLGTSKIPTQLAFATTCGNTLTKYQTRTGGTVGTGTCGVNVVGSDYVKVMNVASNMELWRHSTGTYAIICTQTSGTSYQTTAYERNPAIAISDSPTSIDPTLEIAC